MSQAQELERIQKDIEKKREELLKLVKSLPGGEVNPCSRQYISKINEIEELLDKMFSGLGFRKIHCPIVASFNKGFEDYITVYRGMHPIGLVLVVIHPFVENKCRSFESRKALIVFLSSGEQLLSVSIIGENPDEELKIARRLGFDIESEPQTPIEEKKEKTTPPPLVYI